MARPRKVSPETVADTVDGMITEFIAEGNVAVLTDYALMDRLKVSPRTIDRYYDGEADTALQNDNNISAIDKERYKKDSYGAAVKRLVEFRRAVCVERIAAGGQVTGWIFLSKQPHWGGFQDVQRTETSGKQRIEVCISGPDGKPLSE